MAEPLVSVIIPTYNRMDSVRRALRSVQAQTWPELEIIVVDDGSTDRTVETLAAEFPEVVCLRRRNGGPASARNAGIRRSTGEFVAMLDSDDVWIAPDKIERQMAAMAGHGDCVACFTDFRTVRNGEVEHEHTLKERNYNVLDGEVSYEKLALQSSILPSTLLARRETLDALGLFDERQRWGEDWDLFTRMALTGRILFLPEATTERTHGEDNLTRDVSPWFYDKLKAVDKHLALLDDLAPDEAARERMRELLCRVRRGVTTQLAYLAFRAGRSREARDAVRAQIRAEKALTRKMVMFYVVSFFPPAMVRRVRGMLAS